MALFRPRYVDKKTRQQKTSAVWWYEFNYTGKRIRESAKTTRKTVAGEAEKRRRLELERAMAGIPTAKPELRIRSVSEALKAYQKAYRVNHDRPKSIAVVEERSVHLDRLLGALLLTDILDPARVLDYMERRRVEGAANRTINMELMVLSRASGQKWSVMWPTVKKQDETTDARQATEPEEERVIMEAARENSSPCLETFLTTLAWTGMRPDKEARLLRWRQIDFEAGRCWSGSQRRLPVVAG